MDNVTHALAGALLAAAVCQVRERHGGDPSPGFRRAAFVAGVVTAELPDADLAYAGAPMGMGNLGYLLHHRGHTHTVLFALVGALVTWGIVQWIRRRTSRPGEGGALLLLSIAGTLSHLALDYTNSYGVHPFWPVDARWYYGDAVFIVEPWFWVVSLPPLFFIARRTAWRALCAVLLAVILVASWRVSMVAEGVAVALTIGAVVWTLVARAATPRRRVTLALAGWGVLELIFFAASVSVRRTVVAEVGSAYRDLALSPTPGNPFCLSALLLRVDGDVYSARRATLATMPRVVDEGACTGESAPRDGAARASRWEERWVGSVADLRRLAQSDCTAAAALRFIRIPRWERRDDGTVVISDLRFGEVNGSFATVAVEPGEACPRHVPGWEFPRRDLLNTSADAPG